MAHLSRVTRTARKVHRCDWCRSEIRPGEVYEASVLKDASGLRRWKAHPECALAVYDGWHGEAGEFPGVLASPLLDDDRPSWWREWRKAREIARG